MAAPTRLVRWHHRATIMLKLSCTTEISQPVNLKAIHSTCKVSEQIHRIRMYFKCQTLDMRSASKRVVCLFPKITYLLIILPKSWYQQVNIVIDIFYLLLTDSSKLAAVRGLCYIMDGGIATDYLSPLTKVVVELITVVSFQVSQYGKHNGDIIHKICNKALGQNIR